MYKPTSLTRPALLILAILSIAIPAQAWEWSATPSADLERSECDYDANSDAEILYKELDYGYRSNQRRIFKHLKIKVYKESALDRARRVKFYHPDYYEVSELHARVIKQDESYLETTKDDIFTDFERETKDYKVMSTAISFPRAEVGDILEYTYTLILDINYALRDDQIFIQEYWPIRQLELKVKPRQDSRGIKWSEHLIHQKRTTSKGYYTELSIKEVPAYPDEPYQAPDTDVKSWCGFYTANSTKSGKDYWIEQSKLTHTNTVTVTKPDSYIKALAKEITTGINSDQEKLRALYNYCVTDIINFSYGEADRLTSKEIEEIEWKWDVDKTLKNGMGKPGTINIAFCALARASGFDSRLTRVADRSKFAFTGTYEVLKEALPSVLVAVKQGEDWIFYNPGEKYLPFGQLDWKHDGASGLIPDKKELILVKTQTANPQSNRTENRGNFELSSDGSISGHFSMQLVGLEAVQLKRMLNEKSEGQRKETLEELLLKTWSNGQIENVTVQNAAHPIDPILIEFDVTIPGYAESVGDRLFLRPNIEERYTEAKFPNNERKTPIFFRKKYLYDSEFSIKLPDGYVIESPTAPAPVNVAGFMDYQPKLSLNKNTNTIIYNRSLSFSGSTHPEKHYPIIKNAFDSLLKNDAHAITLKKSEGEDS